MGLRRSREILLLDRPMLAKEAVKSGYANGIIKNLGDNDFFDLDKVPTIGKLLEQDYRTLVNTK